MQPVDNFSSDSQERTPREPEWQRMDDKNHVVRFEQNNFDKVALFAAGGGFWNATEHSCFFMVNMFQEGLKLVNQLHNTYDYYFKDHRFFVAYNAEQVKMIRETVSVRGFKVLRDDEKVFVFEIGEVITPGKVREWTMSEEAKRKQLDTYFLPDTGATEIYTFIRNLMGEVAFANDQMRGGARGLFADRMMDMLVYMYELYNSLVEGEEEGNAAIYIKMLRVVGNLALLSSVAGDQKIIDDRRMMRMGNLLVGLRREIEGGIKKGNHK